MFNLRQKTSILYLMKAYRFIMMLVLINALMAQTFPKTLVLLDYYFHTDVYAAYCINKDRPEMECNGRCQLDQKMDNMEHHHQDSNRLIEISFSTYLPTEPLFVKPKLTITVKNRETIYRPPFIPEEWVEKPLLPPQFLV